VKLIRTGRFIPYDRSNPLSSRNLYLVDFPGRFILPITPLLQRPVQSNGSGAGAVINTTAAIPAFIRVQYHGRLAFLRIGHIYIYLADFHAVIAPVTDIRIESDRITRRG
jgi:hypothetical protein